MALQFQRAKTDWSGCCQMTVQEALWLAKRLSLNLNIMCVSCLEICIRKVPHIYWTPLVMWAVIFGMVVSTSDCHSRGPGFDSRLYPRPFSGSIGSGMWSTQPREDNWIATWMRNSEIWLRKLKLRLRDKCFANHKAPCTVIWQQPLQSVLALWSYSATDF